MTQSIDAWLRQLDAICAENEFESAQEAEAWLRSMSEGLDIDEFFDQHAPAEGHLKGLLHAAEQVDTPAEAAIIYERAVLVGERFFASTIIEQVSTDVPWEQSSLHLYTLALSGLASCQELQLQENEAQFTYRKMLRVDPLDRCRAFDKLFCLLIANGLVADAAILIDSCRRNDSIAMYQRALLSINQCADQLEMNLAMGEASASESDDQTDVLRPAMQSIDLALRANRYLPHILTHPQSLSLDWQAEPKPGSPCEALLMVHAMAHLWLSDWIALEMLLEQAARFPLSHGGHEEEWQAMLNAMGGKPTSEEQIAYMQAIEAQAMESSF